MSSVKGVSHSNVVDGKGKFGDTGDNTPTQFGF